MIHRGGISSKRPTPPRAKGTKKRKRARTSSPSPSAASKLNSQPRDAELAGPEPQYLRNRRLGLAVERGRVAAHCLVIVALLDLCGYQRRRYTTLVKAVRDAVKPRHKMVIENAPIPKYLVGGYRRHQHHIADLTQVAQLGLIKAVDTFRPSDTRSFSHYAAFVVRRELNKAWTRLSCRSLTIGKDSLRELAVRHRNQDPAMLAQRAGVSVEHASDLLQAAGSPVFVDAPRTVGGEGSEEYYQLPALANDAEHDLITREEERDTHSQVHGALQELPELHRIVIVARLMTDTPESHASISRRLGIRICEVQQIESKAIELMRNLL